MYAAVVRRIVRRAFRRLSAGDYDDVLARFAPEAVLVLGGDHALSGEQRGVEAVRRWFERLFRLFPGLWFEPVEIAVSGWPWETVTMTRLRLRGTLPGGRAYANEGIQLLRLRWGHVIEDRLYEDTQGLAAALRYLAQQGVEEVSAPPLPVQAPVAPAGSTTLRLGPPPIDRRPRASGDPVIDR